MNKKRYGPDLIRQIKLHSNISQHKLAKLLHITQQAVSDYSRGKVEKERYDVIKKLEEFLNNAIIENVQKEAKKLPPEKEARIKNVLIKNQHEKKSTIEKSDLSPKDKNSEGQQQ